MSQSPQTGQVYFNLTDYEPIVKEAERLNPLKRVKFISIQATAWHHKMRRVKWSLNPLKRVKFISICQWGNEIKLPLCLNPLKRVKFISISYWRTWIPQAQNLMSQSPQTGQVYFNNISRWLQENYGCLNPLKRVKFISIWVQFQVSRWHIRYVSIPSNGSSLFQCNQSVSHKFLGRVSIPSNGSSLFQ